MIYLFCDRKMTGQFFVARKNLGNDYLFFLPESDWTFFYGCESPWNLDFKL